MTPVEIMLSFQHYTRSNKIEIILLNIAFNFPIYVQPLGESSYIMLTNTT